MGLDCGDSLCPVLKSTTHQSGTNFSLYTAWFGTNPKCGHSSTSLLSGIISHLHRQQNLQSVLSAHSDDSGAPTSPADALLPMSETVLGSQMGRTANLN